MKMMRSAVAAVAALMSLMAAHAVDYIWTGAEDACWTNSANWTDGSGNAVSKCPGVAATGDSTADWAAARSESDKAIFSQSSQNTTVDIDGLFAISKITFSGAATPAYAIGTGSGQVLPLRPGAVVTVDSSVVNMPSIAAKINFAKGYTESTSVLDLYNNAEGEFYIGGLTGATKDPAYTVAWFAAIVKYRGNGGFRIGSTTILSDIYAYTKGKIRIAGSYDRLRFLCFYGTKEIEIEDGVNLAFASNVGHYIDLNSSSGNVAISGSGTVKFWSTDGNLQSFKNARGNLKFYCPVSEVSTYNHKGILFESGYGGSVEFANTVSNLRGPIEVTTDAIFRASSIGANGEATQAGTGSLIKLANSGKLEYTGAGETTSRSIELSNGTGSLVQSGRGAWTVSSPVNASGASTTLRLAGGEPPLATLATAVSSEGTIGFTKSGAGVWRLTGASAFNGAVLLEGGTLRLATAAAAAFAGASGVTIKSGAVLDIEDGVSAVSLPGLTAGSGGGVVYIPDGCTVTLQSAPTSSGGAVDFRISGSGKLLCPSAAGTVLSGVTIDGVSVVADSSGECRGDSYPTASTVIAARGGVIPNGAGEVVAIGLPGEEGAGPITLASADTAIDVLVQKETVPATVSLGGGTLAAGTLAIMPQKAALTVGSAVGDGTVASGAALALESHSEQGGLCVNSTLSADGSGSTLTKIGSGEAEVKDLEGTWDLRPTGGRLSASSSSGSKVTASVTNGARLRLSDIESIADTPAANTYSGLFVGNAGKGILEIGPGTAMTNRLYVGYGSGGCGAVYQSGGYFYNRAKSGDDDQHRPGIGFQGYGYYELRGGTYAEGGYIGQMCAVANAVAVLDIYGGSAEVGQSSGFWMNAKTGATGVIVVRGGSYSSAGSVRYPDNSGNFVFMQEGSGSSATYGGLIEFWGGSGSTSTFTLNGGVLKCGLIGRRNTSVVACFNFNGGTMRYKANNAFFKPDTNAYAVNHVVSHGRGAIFDTDGSNASLGASLEAPVGLGVASIDWSADAAAVKYVGAPAVLISGDGFGATACADFDYLTGCVTNIRVTCSGSGYTAGNVTASLKYNSTTRSLPVTLGPVTPGGIVKKGNGVLTLDKACTYGGETAVEAGTLKAGVEGAIPSGGMLRLDGGTLDLNGMEPTFSGICGAGGAVVNGSVTLSGEWAVDAARRGVCTVLDGDLSFAEGATVRVESPGSLDPSVCKRHTLVRTTGGHSVSGVPQVDGELPDGWQILSAGDRVVLTFKEGMMLLFR